jgi:hypothetical protein
LAVVAVSPMLEETPNRKLVLECLSKLAPEVGVTCSPLAKVSASGPAQDFFLEVVFLWVPFASRDDADFQKALSNVKRKTAALQRPLEKVHQYLKATTRRLESGHVPEPYDLDFAALELLPLSKVDHILAELTTLTNALSDAVLRKGALRRGPRHYPGLYELVWALELHAQDAGGAFTVHRKAGAKGSLIQALDWLRNRVLAIPELRHLADFIPPRDKHPIALYERILKDFRKKRTAAVSGC